VPDFRRAGWVVAASVTGAREGELSSFVLCGSHLFSFQFFNSIADKIKQNAIVGGAIEQGRIYSSLVFCPQNSKLVKHC
jgi:hypothetical protein